VSTAFTSIQTTNQETNRIQTNISTSVSNLSNQVNQVTLIGEIKYSTLNLNQVQSQLGASWVSCDKSSCIGTTYNKITGFLVLPNIPTASGISAYIRIN
jgi:hypothetical protein